MNKIIYNQKFLAFLGLVGFILVAIPLAKNINKRHEIDNEIKDLESEIVSMESKNEELKKLVTYLESDQFVEEQARLNLGLKKQGESAVVITEETDGEIQADTSADKLSEEKTNPEKWLNYFFGS